MSDVEVTFTEQVIEVQSVTQEVHVDPATGTVVVVQGGGPQGVPGVGLDGQPGGLSVNYLWSIDGSVSDPGDGVIKCNGSGRKLSVSSTDNSGTSVSTLLNQIDDSTSAINGYIRLWQPSNEQWCIFSVSGLTDHTTWVEVDVVIVSIASGGFSDGGFVWISFTANGSKGDPGDPATNLVSSVNSQTGDVVLTASDVGADDFGTASAAVASEASDRADADALLIPLTQKAAINGVATLDGSATIPDNQIPSTITRDTEVTSAVSDHTADTDPHGDRAYADGLFAPKANPTLTGTVTVPTAVAGTSALNRDAGDARYQAINAALTSISALTVDAYGLGFLTLTTAALARSKLALGTSAIVDTGTGAGNVILGNDSRLTDSRSPSGAAGGVLSGTYPNPGFATTPATATGLANEITDRNNADVVLAAAIALKVTKAGDTMTGDLSVTGVIVTDTDGTGDLELPLQVSVPAAVTGSGKLYASKAAVRPHPTWRPGYGGAFRLARERWGHMYWLVTPLSAATVRTEGHGAVAVTGGTLTTPASTADGMFTNYAPAAAATSSCASTAGLWRRGAAGDIHAGWDYHCRAKFPNTQAAYDSTSGVGTNGTRLHFGLMTNTVANNLSNDYGLISTSMAMFARDSIVVAGVNGAQDVNWKFVTCESSTRAVVDTGIPMTTAHVYDFHIECPAGSSTVYWRIDDVTAGTTASGTTSTNVPSAGQNMLTIQGSQNNFVAGVQGEFQLQWVYMGDMSTLNA